MNIFKITPALWEAMKQPSCPVQYVGRGRYQLGLGNPFSHQNGRQVQFIVSSEKEAIKQYKDWVNDIVEAWMQGHKQGEYKEQYLKLLLKLASDIETGKVTGLATYDFYAVNYQPVEDGDEQSHAEILYKECLRVTEFLKQRTSIK